MPMVKWQKHSSGPKVYTVNGSRVYPQMFHHLVADGIPMDWILTNYPNFSEADVRESYEWVERRKAASRKGWQTRRGTMGARVKGHVPDGA